MPELKQYQKETARHAVERLYDGYKGHEPIDSVFVLDEVGLGKTYEAVGILLRARKRVGKKKFQAIILTPSGKLIKQWQGVLSRFPKHFVTKHTDTALQTLLDSEKPALVSAAMHYGGGVQVGFASGAGLKSFNTLNWLERRYVASFFTDWRVGAAFFRRLNVEEIPDVDVRTEFAEVSKKDGALRRAIKNYEDKGAEGVTEFKKLWLEAVGLSHPFDMVVVDEFHNYISLLAKKRDQKEGNLTPSADVLVWDEFFRVSERGRDLGVKKVFLSATPFRPIRLNVKLERQQDPVSYILDGLSNSFTKNNKQALTAALTTYNEQALDIREKIARSTNRIHGEGGSPVTAFMDDAVRDSRTRLLKTKREIEKVFDLYLLRNKRLQKRAVRKDQPAKVSGEEVFKGYLSLHEAIFKSGLGNRGERLQTMFTSGNFFEKSYQQEGYVGIQDAREVGKKHFDSIQRLLIKHPKLEKLRDVLVADLGWPKQGNMQCWLTDAAKRPKKALIFCSFKGTATYLGEHLSSQFSGSTKQLDPSNVLKRECEEMFVSITKLPVRKIRKYMQDSPEFYKYLPVYIKRWGLRSVRKITPNELKNYIKKNKLRAVLGSYFHDVCLDNTEVFFDNLRGIAEWSFMRASRQPITLFKQSSGGDKKRKDKKKTKKKSGSERLEDLKTAFNSPFYPFAVVSTNAGAEGINFHSYCQNVIHYEQDWMPQTIEQRTGRVDRLYSLAARLRKSQVEAAGNLGRLCESPHNDEVLECKEPNVEVCNDLIEPAEPERINVYRLVMDGTIDEYMYNRERERALWTELFIGGQDASKMLDSSVGLNDISVLNDERYQKSLTDLIDEISVQIGRKRPPFLKERK